MSSFKHFCGGQFWNVTSVWETEDPELTSCFQRTVLSWALAAVLLLCSASEVTSWLTSSSPPLPRTVLNSSKLLLSLGLAALCVTRAVLLERSSESEPSAEYLGTGVMLTSYLYSATLLSFSVR